MGILISLLKTLIFCVKILKNDFNILKGVNKEKTIWNVIKIK